MTGELLTVPIEHPQLDTVSAIFDEASVAGDGTALVLANGAGLHMGTPWMEQMALGLAGLGYAVLRFNYPYQERALRDGTRRPPDPRARREATHERVVALLRERARPRRLLLAGKSMGARMSSHLAAKGIACHGLLYFGYPLHPAGKPDKLRVEHFPAIAQPTLFLQGTRDALCDLTLLERELPRYGGVTTLEIVEGADHSFHLPKKSGMTDEQVRDGLLERVARWVSDTFPT